jgi:hypothetical protein
MEAGLFSRNERHRKDRVLSAASKKAESRDRRVDLPFFSFLRLLHDRLCSVLCFNGYLMIRPPPANTMRSGAREEGSYGISAVQTAIAMLGSQGGDTAQGLLE